MKQDKIQQHTPLLIELLCEEIPSRDCLSFERSAVKFLPALADKYTLSSPQLFITPRRIVLSASSGKSVGVETVRSLASDLIKNLAAVSRLMRWDSPVIFSRPIRNIAIFCGKQFVPVEIAGIPSRPFTTLPRYRSDKEISVRSLSQYLSEMKKAGVILDQNERRAKLRQAIESEAEKRKVSPIIPSDLLDEVVYLVESVAVCSGEFDTKYLVLPEELILQTAQKNQRYFLSRNAANGFGGLTASALTNVFFIAAACLPAGRQGTSTDKKTVVRGNERVLHARLEDAYFYYQLDARVPLEIKKEELSRIPIHPKVGTVADKVARMQKIASALPDIPGLDRKELARAIEFSKLDYATDLGREFPELRGAIGAFLLKDKEPASIAEAIRTQYMPNEENGEFPKPELGMWLALTDKLEHVISFIGNDVEATSETDPFGLRRSVMGFIRIVWQQKNGSGLPIAVHEFVNTATRAALSERSSEDLDSISQKVNDFIAGRSEVALVEGGVPAAIARAVARKPILNFAFERRVSRWLADHAGDAMFLDTVKRIVNIIKKETITSVPTADVSEDEKRIQEVVGILDRVVKDQNPELLSGIVAPTQEFFKNVMVLDKDPEVRKRRVYLVSLVRDAMGKIFNPEALLGQK